MSTDFYQTDLGSDSYLGEDDLRFLTSEHHFVYLKAKVFSDKTVMAKVLSVRDPAEAKKLGRKISPFNEEIWARNCYKAMFLAVLTKFQKTPRLKKLLLETGDAYIAEAAGYDYRYGLGLWEFSSQFIRGCKTKNGNFDVLPENWEGANLLGIALMEVRATSKRY